MSAEAIASHFDRMRGRMLGLIESWGLPATQERGAKSLFKSLSYDAEAEIKELFSQLGEEYEDDRVRLRILEKLDNSLR